MGSCLSLESRSLVVGGSNSSRRIRKSRSLNKRFGSRNSERGKDDHKLSRIKGRIFSNGASDISCLFSKQGKKGTNQDAMISWENFGSRADTVFCGVFDGHGPHGHMVAKRVRDSLPVKFSHDMNAVSEKSAMAVHHDDGDEKSELLKETFLRSFKNMDMELRLQNDIDCFCSGTTAVTLIKQGGDLIVGNVGDSRAVLGTRNDDGDLVAVQLTVDLKPNLPEEAERIRKCRGRVFALKDEPDVERVWLPNNDAPGLAMTRAFGDFCLKDFGLISVPDVSHHRLNKNDEFVVLATDGIWDVLSNEEVVDVVASAPTRSAAARLLVQTAVRGWKVKYPTSKADDCAAVCLFIGLDCGASAAVKTEPVLQSTELVMKEEEDDDASVVTLMECSGTLRNDEAVSRVDTLLTVPRFRSDGP